MKPVRPNTIARSIAIGSPADGDLAVATARDSGGAIYAVAEDEIAGEHRAARRDDRRLRRDGAGRDARRAARGGRRGELGEDDRVVLLVTGDGLKTPGLVADRFDPIRVQPDADQILETLGVQV